MTDRRAQKSDAPRAGVTGSARGVVRADVAVERPLVRRLWRFAQGVGAAALATMGLGAALHAPAVTAAAYGLGAILASAAALSSLFLRGRAPRWEVPPAQAVASAEGLRLGGEPLVPREELVEAVVTPRGDELPWPFARVRVPPAWVRALFGRLAPEPRVEVAIRRRGFYTWPLRFVTRTVEEARALLDALRLGVAHRAITRKVMSPVLRPSVSIPLVFGGFGLGVLGGILAAATGVRELGLVLAAAFPLGLGTIYTLGLVKTKVTIGADGVSVRWLGRPRTIALEEIASVEVVPAQRFMPAVVRVARKAGPPFDIAVGLRGGNLFEPFILAAECALVVERIREAMALGARAQPVEFRAWAAGRVDVPVREWIAMLRGTLDAYRAEGTMPFSPADLWAVLENPRATPAERVAAAVAVTARRDARVEARLRDAAAATALPRVRAAFDAAVAGDDEALANALEALRAEERAQHGAGGVVAGSSPAGPRVRVADGGAGGEGSGEETATGDAEAASAEEHSASTRSARGAAPE